MSDRLVTDGIGELKQECAAYSAAKEATVEETNLQAIEQFIKMFMSHPIIINAAVQSLTEFSNNEDKGC